MTTLKRSLAAALLATTALSIPSARGEEAFDTDRTEELRQGDRLVLRSDPSTYRRLSDTVAD